MTFSNVKIIEILNERVEKVVQKKGNNVKNFLLFSQLLESFILHILLKICLGSLFHSMI